MHIAMIAKANLFYRFNSLTIAFAVFIREIVSIAVIYLLFTRFGELQGWTRDDLLFLYSFLFLSYSLVVFFFAGVRDFEDDVREGNCDRYLLRPLGVFFQVVACKSDYAASLGHGLMGVALFLYSAGSVGIEWKPTTVAYAVAFLGSGVLIQTSIFMFTAALSFWTVRSTNIRNIIFFNARRYSGYPVSIYPEPIKVLLIYVVPFAFVNYFPAQHFLHRADGFVFSPVYLLLPPMVAMMMVVVASAAWASGLRNYSSVGN
jgi:ABC-2 type transport system permease protein